MPELFPKDIEAIARAAYEAHTGDSWDDVTIEAKTKWRDTVEPAIAGRNSEGGIPAIEAAIVKAYNAHVSLVYDPSLIKSSDASKLNSFSKTVPMEKFSRAEDISKPKAKAEPAKPETKKK